MDCDYLFKVLFIGDSNCGKTALTERIVDNVFHDSLQSTIGIDFKFKTILLPDTRISPSYSNIKTIKLQIWDAAGQEKFKSIVSSYYRNSHIVFIVYDLTNMNSFNNIEKWLSELKKQCLTNPIITILGNKCDLKSKRCVTDDDIDKLLFRLNNSSNDIPIKHYITSAKNNYSDFNDDEIILSKVFNKTVELCYYNYNIQLNNTIKLTNDTKSFSKCCH